MEVKPRKSLLGMKLVLGMVAHSAFVMEVGMQSMQDAESVNSECSHHMREGEGRGGEGVVPVNCDQ